MKTTYQNRLDKLEQWLKPTTKERGESAVAFQQALTYSMFTMSLEDRLEFMDALELWLNVHVRRTKPRDTPMLPACNVLNLLIQSHFLDKRDRPLSVGPAVFGAVRDGSRVPIHEREATTGDY